MIKIIVAVFVGGAVGAILRELFMLIVPNLADGFPLDILAANLVASFLLGFATTLHSQKVVSDDVNSLLGTALRRTVDVFQLCLWRRRTGDASATGALVASAYVVVSLVMGYVAVVAGLMLGRKE